MSDLPPLPLPAATRVRRLALMALALALVLAVWGIVSRLSARNTLGREAAEAAVATVATVKPSRGPASNTLVLPGSVQAYYEAPIYARTSGYLKTWYTDIGTTVKKGQLLAEIDAPEVDQQLRQAQADLATGRPTTSSRAPPTSDGRVCSRRSRFRSRTPISAPGMRPPRRSAAIGGRQPGTLG